MKNLVVPSFFYGFSSPDFAKISAAILRIFLVRSRALETQHVTDFVSFFRFFSMSFCVFLRNGDGHGNGYDHDCCGSTTTAITTLAMVTIAEPMSGLDPPSHLTSPGNQGGNARGNQGGPPYGPSTLTRRVRTL